MKLNSLLIYICASVLFFGCKKEIESKKEIQSTKTTTLLDNEYLIKGQTFNTNSNSIYLYKNYSKDSLVPIDTSLVVNNAFEFKGIIKSPAYLTVKTNANNTSYKFLGDAATIDLFLHNNLGLSSINSKSEILNKYKEYVSKLSEFKNEGVDLYYNLKGDFSKSKLAKLKEQRADLFKEQSDYVEDFIKNNPDGYLSAILLNDNIDYFSLEKLRLLFNGLPTDVKEEELGKALFSNIVDIETIEKEKLEKLSTTTPTKTKASTTGEYRPNAYAFSGLTPDGNRMSFASIPKGKVVLLDFWASWCAPCRATNPNLVQLYNKFKNQGLVIMSISEDKGESEWISAIYADNLSWKYHILDKNKSIAFRYGVESIPHKILIDKNGKIASGKISGSALESRIRQLLAE